MGFYSTLVLVVAGLGSRESALMVGFEPQKCCVLNDGDRAQLL